MLPNLNIKYLTAKNREDRGRHASVVKPAQRKNITMKEIELNISTRVMPAILNSEIHPLLRCLLQALRIMPKEVLPLTLLSYVGRESFEAYRRYRVLYPLLVVSGILMWPTLVVGSVRVIDLLHINSLPLCFVTLVLSGICFPIFYGIALDYYLSNERPRWKMIEYHAQIVISSINLLRARRGRPRLKVGNFPIDYMEIRKLIDDSLLDYARLVIEMDGQYDQEFFRSSMKSLAHSAVELNYAEDARKGIRPYFDRVEKE